MRWASYCCLLPVPRASNGYQWPALFANDLCTETLAKKRKQRAKHRMSAGSQSKGAEEETEPSSRPAATGERGGTEASHPAGVRRRHRALLGDLAHIPLCMGDPLPPCLSLSCNSPLLSHTTSYFFHMPPASSRCSASRRPLPGHAEALLAGWSSSGPSWQPLLPAGERAGEVSRWHNSPFIRFVELLCC